MSVAHLAQPLKQSLAHGVLAAGAEGDIDLRLRRPHWPFRDTPPPCAQARPPRLQPGQPRAACAVSRVRLLIAVTEAAEGLNLCSCRVAFRDLCMLLV